MANKAVFGIAETESQAIAIADNLKADGFTESDVSVLSPDKQGTKDFAHEQHTKAPEGTAAGATGGAVLGGALGWMVAIGSLAIPGLGPFIAPGPIMAALAGGGGRRSCRGAHQSTHRYGPSEYEAKRYKGKIKGRNILLSVHTDDGNERARAKKILESGGAEDVSYTGEASVPKDQKRPTIYQKDYRRLSNVHQTD
jgi:hypothetical protein